MQVSCYYQSYNILIISCGITSLQRFFRGQIASCLQMNDDMSLSDNEMLDSLADEILDSLADKMLMEMAEDTQQPSSTSPPLCRSCDLKV